MQALSKEGLIAKTEEFKKRLGEGETLDDLLPEAFAVVREAAKRVLQNQLRPLYNVPMEQHTVHDSGAVCRNLKYKDDNHLTAVVAFAQKGYIWPGNGKLFPVDALTDMDGHRGNVQTGGRKNDPPNVPKLFYPG